MASPLILGLGGWWLDGRLHTGPWFAVAAVLLGITGATIKLVTDYRSSMATHAAARSASRSTQGGAAKLAEAAEQYAERRLGDVLGERVVEALIRRVLIGGGGQAPRCRDDREQPGPKRAAY